LKSVQKKFKNSLTHDIGFVILRSHTETQISHMRTKTLLLTAALTAAGVATSMAQVYSVNMVGYINLSVPRGFSLIANQLNASPDNKVTTILPAPPEGTQIYKFDPTTGGYIFMQFIDGAWEGDSTETLLGPGEGAFINNVSASAFTATFVGEVALTTTLAVPAGFSMASSALPQSLPLTGAPNDGNPAPPVGLGYPVGEGDQVYQFDNTTGGYVFNQYIDGAWEGDSGGAAPTPAIGESFWVNAAGARSWSRNFVVGVD
jgi:hypothetical protein